MPIDPSGITWDSTPKPAAPAPQAPRPPAFIGGQVTPTKQAEAARAAEDQAMQREQLRLSQAASERASQGEVRAQQTFEGTGGAPTEGQAKAGTLYSRIKSSALDIEDVLESFPEADRPTISEAVLFNGLGNDSIVARNATEWQKRAVRDAQADILDALLTLGTGAAYTKEQLQGQTVSYFPQYGDSKEEVAYKRRRLTRMIGVAREQAGPAAADLDAALAPFLGALSGDEPTDEQGLEVVVTDDTPSPFDPGGPQGPVLKTRVDGNDPGYMQFAAGVGDVVQGGINNTVGLLANPVNASINEAFGTNMSNDLGGVLRDALGLPYGDETIGAINQAASGGLGAAGVARAAGQRVAGTAGNALAEYGSRPILDMASAGSAAASGEAAKALGGGPVAQTAATLLGGGVPSVAALGRNKLASGGGGAPPSGGQREVIAAGERRAVPIRKADVVPEVRGERSSLRTSERGGPLIRQAEADDIEAMERSVANDVAGGRPSVGREGVGNTGQAAVTRKSDKMRTEAQVWYKRADAAAGDAKVPPSESLSRLDTTIERLRTNGANANQKTISYLEGLREDFANGLTVAGIRDQRTNMRANIREAGLEVNKTEALVLDIIDGASADLQRGLAGNPKALNAYKKADKLWAERSTFRKEVLTKLVGPKGDKSPEAVADNIKRLARDDIETFGKFWETLEYEEAADIAATFAISQGRDNSGNWSPARFVSDLTGDDLGTKASISPKALRMMYGEEGMQAIRDLKTIASAKKAAASETNVSKTGNVIQSAARGLRTLLLTGFGFATGGPVGAIAAPAAGGVLKGMGEERAARLMLNPDFTKWLKNAPEASNPQAINSYFKKLEATSAKSAVFAGDVKAFQESMREAFQQSPGRLAAAEDENNAGPKPPQ